MYVVWPVREYLTLMLLLWPLALTLALTLFSSDRHKDVPAQRLLVPFTALVTRVYVQCRVKILSAVSTL